jgi:hypothetical protein
MLLYVDTNDEVGHPGHLRAFATKEVAKEWFKEIDPEGIAFEYSILFATRR